MVLILDKENHQFTKIKDNVLRITWGEYRGDIVYSDIQLDILNSEFLVLSGKDVCDCMNNFPSKRTAIFEYKPNFLSITFKVSECNIGYTDYFYFGVNLHRLLIEAGQDVNTPTPKLKKCTCGAAQTSNPNFHSSWCDIN